jgi:hypothetical protein
MKAGAVVKLFFNRKERKVSAKIAKTSRYNSFLCVLCEISLRSLRLKKILNQTLIKTY